VPLVAVKKVPFVRGTASRLVEMLAPRPVNSVKLMTFGEGRSALAIVSVKSIAGEQPLPIANENAELFVP
jgi:hypothetical protein